MKPPIFFLIVVILLAIVTAADAQISFSRMITMTDMRAKARTTRLNLENVLSLLKDMETGSRGFAITGQASYLEPYNDARTRLPKAYTQLKSQYAGAELPTGFSWAQLDGLVNRRFQLSEKVVQIRIDQGTDVIENIALFDQGKKTMDEIRVQFGKLDAFQDVRIDQLNTAVHQLRKQAETFSWITAIITALMVSIALYLLKKERNARNQLELQLRQANQFLEQRVSERTQDLIEANARISGFALEQENAIEKERRRLSREVHDQIGQIFTAIKLIISSVQEQYFPQGQHKVLHDALESGIMSARRITAELRPPLLDDLGFEAALDFHVGQFAASAGYQYEVEIDDVDRLNEMQVLALFRITQEAMSNIIKYAHASHVGIKGTVIDNRYSFTIADNGDGFQSESLRPGALGLVAIRERAALLGGTCSIQSRLKEGTSITIQLPIDVRNT